MSIHSSLRSKANTGKALRNVMKRFERVRHLMDHSDWEEGRSVFGLPKIKQVKLKARKAAAKDKDEATAETPAPDAKAASSS